MPQFPKGGAPNAVTLGSDGMLYAAQNGGVVGEWRSSTPCAPAVERISLEGRIETLIDEIAGVKLGAPNDLVFGPDGRLYFTDPGEPYNPLARLATNRLFAIGRAGGEVLLELEPAYTNGIAFTVEEQLCWVESYEGTSAYSPRASAAYCASYRRTTCPTGLTWRTMAVCSSATLTSHGITVVSPDGKLVDHIYLDDDALPTNCCFEGSTLWVSDFGTDWEHQRGCGRLWRLETDAIGAGSARPALGVGSMQSAVYGHEARDNLRGVAPAALRGNPTLVRAFTKRRMEWA